MKVGSLLALTCAGLAAGSACAETVAVGDQLSVRESSVPCPERGMTMAGVEARFGPPVERHPTVGKPPITRWDYAGFAVFFEADRVIHSVVTSG